MTVVIVTVVTVTVVIFVTVVIVTVATVAAGTVVIETYFSKNNLTPQQQIFSGQLFAILAMFFYNWSAPKFSKYKIPCKLAKNFSKCQRW